MIDDHLARGTKWRFPSVALFAVIGAAGCAAASDSRSVGTVSSAETYDTCASCTQSGWSSDPRSANPIEDHLTAMCCLRAPGEVTEGYSYAVCDYLAYDWDCAQDGAAQDDGTPGCPGSGLYAQRWIAYWGFDSAPTYANYTGDAAGSCGSGVMGLRYK